MPWAVPLGHTAGIMLDRLRAKTFAALSSKTGDKLLPVKMSKKAALFVNDLVGRPLADGEELERRAAFEARKQQGDLRDEPADQEKVPVVVFHKGDSRDLGSMCKVLDEHKVDYDLRDIEEDEPTQEAIERESGGRSLPVLFIAGVAIGGTNAVRRLASSGELERMVAAREAAARPQEKLGALGDPNKPVQVYGSRTCPWTGRSQALLEREDVEFDYIDLDSPEGMKVADRLGPETGHNTEPWIFVRGQFLGGYNALDELARLGQLQVRALGESARRGRTRVVVAERDNSDELAPGEVLDRQS